MMYQVGLAQAPEKSDPMFISKAEAMRFALLQNSEGDGDTVFAVWDVTTIGNPVTLCLVYQGDIYKA